jgi:hypothetical protein
MRPRRRKRRKAAAMEERVVDGGEVVVGLEGEDVDEVRREGFKEWTGFIYVCWRQSWECIS